MKERPILFSTEMVRAILDGRKSQTRRIIKPQPMGEKFSAFIGGYDDIPKMARFWTSDLSGNNNPLIQDIKCPYGQIGDILWVRETWQRIEGDRIIYKADPIVWGGKWKPSIFMPKVASRIKLKVTNIRVERVQDITEEDAVAEGCERAIKWIHTGKIEFIDESHVFYKHSTYKDGHEMLWNKINGKDSWQSNPWVWVIEFGKI